MPRNAGNFTSDPFAVLGTRPASSQVLRCPAPGSPSRKAHNPRHELTASDIALAQVVLSSPAVKGLLSGDGPAAAPCLPCSRAAEKAKIRHTHSCRQGWRDAFQPCIDSCGCNPVYRDEGLVGSLWRHFTNQDFHMGSEVLAGPVVGRCILVACWQ